MSEKSNVPRPPDVNILVIGTLDTKAAEIGQLASLIEARGARPTILDASTRESGHSGEPLLNHFRVIPSETVADAAGTTFAAVSTMERGVAISRMRAGVTALVVQLATQGEIHGAVCIGGAGAHLAGPAFQALELGFPKLVVTPLASGKRTFEPYVGLRDVAVLHSVADIAGVNAITSRVYLEAAGYIVGAAQAYASASEATKLAPAIAVSMNGNTTPALARAMAQLEESGFSCVAFHANGVGGRAFEEFISSGEPVGVLDYTTTELGAHLVGGLMDAGANRMESAGRKGIPQVLVPGCVDFITCGRWEATEREFPGRSLYRHNPELTLVRLTAEEMRQLAYVFAEKANRAQGPTAVMVPTGGFSVPDAPGGPFWDPDADSQFTSALRDTLQSHVRLDFLDAHINDGEFADAVVGELMSLIDTTLTARPEAPMAT
jgi:uncharacterized protein (UPF0261 family)